MATDDDTKKIIEGIERTLQEISDYLTWLRQDRFVEARRNATVDRRQPYLAGRQPRRDGDSYGTVPRSTTGGAYGTQAKGGPRGHP